MKVIEFFTLVVMTASATSFILCLAIGGYHIYKVICGSKENNEDEILGI